MNSLQSIPGKSRWFVFALFIAANLMTFSTSAASIPVQSFHKDADGVTLAMRPGSMKLTVCSDSIVRVMYSPAATLPAGQDFVVTNHLWRKTSFKVADSSGKLTLTTGKLKVAVDKATSGGVLRCVGQSAARRTRCRRQNNDRNEEWWIVLSD